MSRAATILAAAALALVLAACAGRAPVTRYYNLAPPTKVGTNGDLVVVLEPLTTDAAYDDERIVYRTNPYRLDYYDYHRWSAAPGVLVGTYLEEALENGGHVRAVRRDLTTDADAILSGRVAAIEEVDVSKERWEGRIVLELQLSDAQTGETLWSEQFEEREPLPAQSPEGLAQALSTAMARIVATAGPAIARHAQATRVLPPRSRDGAAKEARGPKAQPRRRARSSPDLRRR
jgi:ABC-type uncharacterized transport system auxiliary subunit